MQAFYSQTPCEINIPVPSGTRQVMQDVGRGRILTLKGT